MIRVELPAHLRTLTHVDGEVKIELESGATQRSVLDAFEARCPMLRGTIRDHISQQRRPFVHLSLAKWACPTSRRTPRFPLPLRRGRNRFLS
jgi:sulfur-carrier protein